MKEYTDRLDKIFEDIEKIQNMPNKEKEKFYELLEIKCRVKRLEARNGVLQGK